MYRLDEAFTDSLYMQNLIYSSSYSKTSGRPYRGWIDIFPYIWSQIRIKGLIIYHPLVIYYLLKLTWLPSDDAHHFWHFQGRDNVLLTKNSLSQNIIVFWSCVHITSVQRRENWDGAAEAGHWCRVRSLQLSCELVWAHPDQVSLLTLLWDILVWMHLYVMANKIRYSGQP